MDLTRSAAALALLVPGTLLAAPVHAAATIPGAATGHAAAADAAATGCAADPSLEHRVLVKKKPVVTRAGERFGMLRFYGGVQLSEPAGGGFVGYDPAWCLDLVMAGEFAGRAPRDRGQVAYDGATARFAGRAATGVLSGGGSSELEGQRVRITYVVDGRHIQARRVMRLVFPEVG